ncbi:DUF1385 domain-containing protein [Candidatus Woesearchaeota archaeon CG08_land_8_20_14_0_20_47_9]|nr:MAG: hypothetical protein AUJ69_01925 [Candidatus Woesearchaeota archaeon CG1_02_47_18]PIO03331.1 MAG: DUF1385 domain-containing protein [Candidatus Woesearchaeota archaeon CG08_land_8_20_14_0_20_47_9]HII30034.1 DUF1385 domain-containing protein [Candidatus Woesearchaeota archaeon]
MRPHFSDIGGQAVIEGVMMRSKNCLAVAVRSPDRSIRVKKRRVNSLAKRVRLFRLPFFRGVLALIENLSLGVSALNYSAEAASGEKERLSQQEIYVTLGVAVVIAILFFIALPLFMTRLLVQTNNILFNIVDGLIRIVIFVAYVAGISLVKEVRVLFQYHGAEHKTIHAYEAGERLVPGRIRKYSTLHLRCGTSFLLIVMVISILLFSLIKSPFWYIKLLYRIVLIPVIAGLSYEILKLSSKFRANPLLRVISWPGLMLQHLTTREPDNAQIKVAVKALEALTQQTI